MREHLMPRSIFLPRVNRARVRVYLPSCNLLLFAVFSRHCHCRLTTFVFSSGVTVPLFSFPSSHHIFIAAHLSLSFLLLLPFLMSLQFLPFWLLLFLLPLPFLFSCHSHHCSPYSVLLSILHTAVHTPHRFPYSTPLSILLHSRCLIS